MKASYLVAAVLVAALTAFSVKASDEVCPEDTEESLGQFGMDGEGPPVESWESYPAYDYPVMEGVTDDGSVPINAQIHLHADTPVDQDTLLPEALYDDTVYLTWYDEGELAGTGEDYYWTAPDVPSASDHPYELEVRAEDEGGEPYNAERYDGLYRTEVHVWIVKLNGYQFSFERNGYYHDVPDPLYVKKGQTVYFRTWLTPSPAPWSDGKPAWTGATVDPNDNTYASATFNDVSETSTSYFNVSAECGNTLTAHVLVYDATIDAYVYGDTERKLTAPSAMNVVASGYVKFQANVVPAGVAGSLNYQWGTDSKGQIKGSPAGLGVSAIDWNAPSTAQPAFKVDCQIWKEQVDYRPLELSLWITKVVLPQIVRVRFVGDVSENEYPMSEDSTTGAYGEAEPEWDVTLTPDRNRAVCYRKNTKLMVEGDLAASDTPGDNTLDLSVNTEIRVFVTAKFGGLSRTFEDNSYQVFDGADWEPTDYGSLYFWADQAMPDEVKEYEDFRLQWTFKVKNFNNEWVEAYKVYGQNYSQETQHKDGTYGFYLVYDTPQEPMQYPWKSVLDKACNWVNGTLEDPTPPPNKRSEPYMALDKVTAGIWSSGLSYDMPNGRNMYSRGTNGYELFYLQALLGDGWTTTVNCIDVAHLVDIHARALGVATN